MTVRNHNETTSQVEDFRRMKQIRRHRTGSRHKELCAFLQDSVRARIEWAKSAGLYPDSQ